MEKSDRTNKVSPGPSVEQRDAALADAIVAAASFPRWSPYDAHEAAAALIQALVEAEAGP